MCEYFLSDIHKIILLIQIHDLILQFNLWLKTNINARIYYIIDNSVNTEQHVVEVYMYQTVHQGFR